MFLEFCSGRLHWDVDTAKNRRGRVSNDLEINITVQIALDQPISPSVVVSGPVANL
jgi:hypothetical protein